MKPNNRSTVKKTNYQGEPKPYKVVRNRDGKIEYRKIQAFQARDYDGELSNWQKGTSDGDRFLVEKRFVSKDKSRIRYTNVW